MSKGDRFVPHKSCTLLADSRIFSNLSDAQKGLATLRKFTTRADIDDKLSSGCHGYAQGEVDGQIFIIFYCCNYVKDWIKISKEVMILNTKSGGIAADESTVKAILDSISEEVREIASLTHIKHIDYDGFKTH